jgi:hypothetical protein
MDGLNMSRREKLTLSSVLASFEESMGKVAAETETTAEVAAPKVDTSKPSDVVSDTEKVTKKAPGDTDDAAAEAEDKETVSPPVTKDEAAKKEAADAVEGLKAIAKTASENSTASMQKEAQEFGKLFAHAVMDEMEKAADTQELFSKTAQQAYNVMDSELFQVKLAQVFEEAYNLTSFDLINAEAYEKTASHIKKVAAESDVETDIEPMKDLIKNAYEITQQLIDNNA